MLKVMVNLAKYFELNECKAMKISILAVVYCVQFMIFTRNRGELVVKWCASGGKIVTDDEAMFERCRSLRNLCFQPQKRFVHEELGWNLRMTNLQAALGVAQLERLDEFVARKRAMGQLYFELLSDIKNLIQLPLLKTSFAENIYWVYGIVLNQNIPFNADFVMRKMAEFGVGTRPFFYPMHLQPVFVKHGLFKGEQYPVSERVAERGFYLPSGMALTEPEIISSATILKKVLNENI
jgi:perosamine synthetase